MKNRKQKIVPCLWFDTQAEEAVNFYTSIFEDSTVNSVVRYPEVGQEIHGKEPGSVMTIDFKLKGYQLLALNGGPHFKFNPSISLFVFSRNQEELHHLWNSLLDGGDVFMPLASYEWTSQYGWLKDKFGLNWQFMIDPVGSSSQQLMPLLFFTGKNHGNTEEAVKFYTSIFKKSEIEGILKYEEEDKNEYAKGTVKHAQFQLEGETFMAMDSGMPNDFPFGEAFSLIVNCDDQKEIDGYWDKLSAGGDPQAQQCGWLKDKFGVSWQVVPEGMEKVLNDPDREKANRAMDAMLKMKKIDLNVLENAVQ